MVKDRKVSFEYVDVYAKMSLILHAAFGNEITKRTLVFILFLRTPKKKYKKIDIIMHLSYFCQMILNFSAVASTGKKGRNFKSSGYLRLKISWTQISSFFVNIMSRLLVHHMPPGLFVLYISNAFTRYQVFKHGLSVI